MKAALSVVELAESQEKNLEKVLNNINVAAAEGSDIVFFAETTISGLIPNDNPSEMLQLGQEIPGPITKAISAACSDNNIWVSIGLLEKEDTRLFDTAVMISANGDIKLKYRRISPRWHWPKSDPTVFCQGESIQCADTDFGRISALICGDLFDEEGQLQRTNKVSPDHVHLLLVRSGAPGEAYDQSKWDKEDIPAYAAQVRQLATTVFAVNHIHDECFGGAWVFLPDGSVAASLPLWQEGMLYYESSNQSLDHYVSNRASHGSKRRSS